VQRSGIAMVTTRREGGEAAKQLAAAPARRKGGAFGRRIEICEKEKRKGIQDPKTSGIKPQKERSEDQGTREGEELKNLRVIGRSNSWWGGKTVRESPSPLDEKDQGP